MPKSTEIPYLMNPIFKYLAILTLVSYQLLFPVNARPLFDLSELNPPESFENVHTKTIYSDSNASVFLIWIKNEVPLHFHRHHTEQVYILEGTGEMLYENDTLFVKPGKWITIPPNVIHGVSVTSPEPLKVISIQAPEFDGSDREWVE